MNKSFLYLEHSGWWIVLILLFSGLLSYLLYSKKNVPWNSSQNKILGSLRFLAVALLLFLLLSPSIQKITNTLEPPVIALAIDNSQSVVSRGTSEPAINEKLDQIEEKLLDLDFEVKRILLDDTSAFSSSTSNISSLISKAEKKLDYENFTGMMLFTDGIFNRGSSPLYNNYIFPIFSVGLGDTIPPKDISISRTLFNRVTYKGNDTPIRLEITQSGYINSEVEIQLTEKGSVVDKQKIRLKNTVQEVAFVVKSEIEGLRHLSANISVLPEESTPLNNSTNVFMEVIDGRKKILIVANSPHPDIRAIRTTLDQTGNYETKIYIPSIEDEEPTDIFDVVIFHGAFTPGKSYTPKENPGIWYILSNQSSITSTNKNLSFVSIDRRGSRPDKVVGSFNQNFSKFKIEKVSAFEEYPPLEVPFGEYKISGPAEVLMYQKLGSIKTQKPLMTVFDDGSQKIALTMGQNIWRWKLQEAAVYENSDQFDNLITKTIQFLSVSNDQKQFRFQPRKTNYSNNESAFFDVEVYNDIYERIYGNPIKINITDENGSSQLYNFTDSEYNPSFRTPFLRPGIYQYEASTQIGDQTFTDKGEFSIQEINPEFLSLTANHLLLRNLSQKTGGNYKHFDEADELLEDIQKKDFKSRIISEEDFIPLYQAWWWYLLIFSLFSVEWFLRRYWGGY